MICPWQMCHVSITSSIIFISLIPLGFVYLERCTNSRLFLGGSFWEPWKVLEILQILQFLKLEVKMWPRPQVPSMSSFERTKEKDSILAKSKKWVNWIWDAEAPVVRPGSGCGWDSEPSTPCLRAWYWYWSKEASRLGHIIWKGQGNSLVSESNSEAQQKSGICKDFFKGIAVHLSAVEEPSLNPICSTRGPSGPGWAIGGTAPFSYSSMSFWKHSGDPAVWNACIACILPSSVPCLWPHPGRHHCPPQSSLRSLLWRKRPNDWSNGSSHSAAVL